MLIPISGPDGDVQEWALVELQGKIEPQRDVDLDESLVVGTMQLSATNQDVVQLQIGYHVLEGKRMALKKPMAILETQQAAAAPSQAEDRLDSSSGSICKVVGVLRHKYLFKTRPRALISKPTGRQQPAV